MIRIVRVHELDPGVPGARFLVDRLWPRGVARDREHNNAVVLRDHLEQTLSR